MDYSSIRRSLSFAAFAAALALPGGDAGAVVYSSNFDPPNFRGTATFDVTQACLDIGTGFANPGTLAGCDVTWLSAIVTFTDAPGVTFDYTAFLPDFDAVSMTWVQDGELGGVISAAIGPAIVSGSSDPSQNGPWWIQFAFSPPDDLRPLDGPPSPGEFGLGVVYLYSGTCSEIEPVCIRNSDPSETAQVENFTRVTAVPEPGTLALVLGALGGAWFSRRRKDVPA
jgi:hypothetical protein